jgi:hypothetical protein
MAHLMQLGVAQSRSEDEYYVNGEPVPNDSVKLIYGYIVRGDAIPPRDVEVVKRSISECDICNTNTICAREVRNSEGRYLFACTHCIKQSPDLVMKYGGNTCTSCTYTRCTHKEKRP